MPVFKATPQKFHVNQSTSDEEEEEDEESEVSPPGDEEEKRRQTLQRLSNTAQELIAQLAAVANSETNKEDGIPAAILLAQAAVVAALTSGPSLPIPTTAHPPIAPLGLSLPNVPQSIRLSFNQKSRPKRNVCVPKFYDSSPQPCRLARRLSNESTQNGKSPTKLNLSSVSSKPSTGEQTKAAPPKPNIKKEKPDESPISERTTTPCTVVPCAVKLDDDLNAKASEAPATPAKSVDPEVPPETKVDKIGLIPLPAPESPDPPKNISNSKRRARELVPCTECSKLMRRGSLREHMDMHNNNGKFPCTTCSKTFSRASALEKHVRVHTGEKPFKCEHCSKAYRQRVHLNEHLRSHTGVRPYICRLCGFSLASKSLLNRHLGTHGVRKNLNDASDLWYKSNAPKEEVLELAAKVGLVLSETTQPKPEKPIKRPGSSSTTSAPKEGGEPPQLADLASSGRKFLCTSCPAGFPTPQALRSHRLTTHGLEFPHKCPECDKSFTSVKGRKSHIREKHPRICPICSEAMPQRRICFLEAHLRDVHCKEPRTTEHSSQPTAPSDLVRQLRSTAKRTSDSGSLPEAPKWKRFKSDDSESSSEGESDTSERSNESKNSVSSQCELVSTDANPTENSDKNPEDFQSENEPPANDGISPKSVSFMTNSIVGDQGQPEQEVDTSCSDTSSTSQNSSEENSHDAGLNTESFVPVVPVGDSPTSVSLDISVEQRNSECSETVV